MDNESRSSRAQAEERLGADAWRKVLNSVTNGQITGQKMHDIALYLVPGSQLLGKHEERMNRPTRMADNAEIKSIFRDWWDNGLDDLTRVEAIQELVRILRTDDVGLHPLAYELENIMKECSEEFDREEEDENLSSELRAEERLGPEIWTKMCDSFFDEEKMKDIARQLGNEVYKLHLTRMEQNRMIPDRAEMIRIFEDWWKLPGPQSLCRLSRKDAVEKLMNALQKTEGLKPLVKALKQSMSTANNGLPRSATETGTLGKKGSRLEEVDAPSVSQSNPPGKKSVQFSIVPNLAQSFTTC